MRTNLSVLAAGLLYSTAAFAQGSPPPVAPPPEPVPEPAVESSSTVGYKGGFFVNSENGLFGLVIQGRVQARFQFESVDDAVTGRDEESAFSLPRVRLTLKGHAFEKDLKYKFQTDFGKGSVELKDFFVDYRVNKGPWIRVGQWKRPFSRQQINSSGRLELVDRAITDKAFGAGRDIGVAVHNNYEKSPEIEWVVGVFNAGAADKPALSGDVTTDPMTGDGVIVEGGFSNVPEKVGPAVVARVGYNANGIKGYQEADLEGGPLRYGVGASVVSEFDLDGDDSSGIRGEIDGIVKVEGTSATAGVYVGSAQSGTSFTDQSYDATGFHVQVGHVLAGKYQPAIRYALVVPDGPDNNQQEITGGFSLYQISHHFKWQTDAGARLTQTAMGSTSDFIARTQLQLAW